MVIRQTRQKFVLLMLGRDNIAQYICLNMVKLIKGYESSSSILERE